MRVFIFGAGYSARAFGAANPEPETRISGTTRSPDKFELLRASGIEPHFFSGKASDEILDELARTTHLVISAGPDETGDPVLGVFARTVTVRMPELEWIGYLSTVGVYGDHGGAWIDEDSECRPVSSRSVARLAAERAWQVAAAEANVPLAILRLSGIYGPGRNAFVNLDNCTAKRLLKPGQVFNRIHVADIASSLWYLMTRNLGGIFNVTDDMPAPPQDVVTAAAAMMGIAPPQEQDFATAVLSSMQRSFYGENKRVSNGKLRSSGYDFAYPDYQAGLRGLWAGDWRGDARTDARSRMKS